MADGVVVVWLLLVVLLKAMSAPPFSAARRIFMYKYLLVA